MQTRILQTRKQKVKKLCTFLFVKNEDLDLNTIFSLNGILLARFKFFQHTLMI
jgi:hypothetical protein